MNQLEPTYNKQCKCIMCKNSFTTKKLRSRFIKVSGYDTDFCPNYSSESMNPILYHIHVCPHCGFSSSDEFSPYFPPGASDLIHSKVCDLWVPHDYGQTRTADDAIKTYKLAVYCAGLKNEKHLTIAGLYMRLAWLYRSFKNESQEQRFMKLAIKEYSESYISDDHNGSKVSITRLLYLIGELSRRTKQTEQAIKYFSKVIEQQFRTTEPNIIGMARDRWYEIREDIKKAKEVILK